MVSSDFLFAELQNLPGNRPSWLSGLKPSDDGLAPLDLLAILHVCLRVFQGFPDICQLQLGNHLPKGRVLFYVWTSFVQNFSLTTVANIAVINIAPLSKEWMFHWQTVLGLSILADSLKIQAWYMGEICTSWKVIVIIVHDRTVYYLCLLWVCIQKMLPWQKKVSGFYFIHFQKRPWFAGRQQSPLVWEQVEVI